MKSEPLWTYKVQRDLASVEGRQNFDLGFHGKGFNISFHGKISNSGGLTSMYLSKKCFGQVLKGTFDYTFDVDQRELPRVRPKIRSIQSLRTRRPALVGSLVRFCGKLSCPLWADQGGPEISERNGGRVEHEVRVLLYLPRTPICHPRRSPSAWASCAVSYI